MGVVGDVVRDRGRLRLEARMRGGHQIGAGGNVVEPFGVRERPVVLENALEAFPGQVEPVMGGVAVFEPGDDADGLHVVVEPAETGHFLVQHALAGVPERGMSEVVRQGDGLGQILVEAQRPGDRARHLADFQCMGQPRAEVLPFVMEEHLGLILQAPEGRRMDDPVAIALEFRACRAIGRRIEAAPALLRI